MQQKDLNLLHPENLNAKDRILRHILTKKSTKRKRALRSADLVEKVDTPAVKKLLPYI